MKSNTLLNLLLLFVALFAYQPLQAQQSLSPAPAREPQPVSPAYSDLTYTIVPSENNTWGYEIFSGGKLLITQKSIPALPGNNGFKEQEQAMRIAELVMQKIRNGEMPPTVTVEELTALGIR